MSTRGSFTSTLVCYGRTRLQKSRLPETALDPIDSVGERGALKTHARHDPQGFTHLRLGKPTSTLEVDSPDDVRLAFAHHDPTRWRSRSGSRAPGRRLPPRAGLRRDRRVRSTPRRTAGQSRPSACPRHSPSRGAVTSRYARCRRIRRATSPQDRDRSRSSASWFRSPRPRSTLLRSSPGDDLHDTDDLERSSARRARGSRRRWCSTTDRECARARPPAAWPHARRAAFRDRARSQYSSSTAAGPRLVRRWPPLIPPARPKSAARECGPPETRADSYNSASRSRSRCHDANWKRSPSVSFSLPRSSRSEKPGLPVKRTAAIRPPG